MGDRGGTATERPRSRGAVGLYPMGDRGGTATDRTLGPFGINYTRWEIGGEPQLFRLRVSNGDDYTRWEIGGEPQLILLPLRATAQLYPMGDRGGTATVPLLPPSHDDYTRWEIGGEPQPQRNPFDCHSIIPDGRSGGNRNLPRL